MWLLVCDPTLIKCIVLIYIIYFLSGTKIDFTKLDVKSDLGAKLNGTSDIDTNPKATPVTCILPPPKTKSSSNTMRYKFFGTMFVCFFIVFVAVILFMCIKRSGLPMKRSRTLTSSDVPRRGGHTLLPVERNTLISLSSNGRTLLTSLDEDEPPPPYEPTTSVMFPPCIESPPPPYTSRPTSINGDFV